MRRDNYGFCISERAYSTMYTGAGSFGILFPAAEKHPAQKISAKETEIFRRRHVSTVRYESRDKSVAPLSFVRKKWYGILEKTPDVYVLNIDVTNS